MKWEGRPVAETSSAQAKSHWSMGGRMRDRRCKSRRWGVGLDALFTRWAAASSSRNTRPYRHPFLPPVANRMP